MWKELMPISVILEQATKEVGPMISHRSANGKSMMGGHCGERRKINRCASSQHAIFSIVDLVRTRDQ